MAIDDIGIAPAASDPSRVVYLWHGNIATVEADYQKYWPMLDADEQLHAGRMKNVLLRKRYVESHGRLRQILAQILTEAPEKIRISKTEHGKPYLIDTPELVFNLSHSENEMIVAVSNNCQLGVDLEFCKPRTNLAGLADKCFSEEEIAYWQKLPEQQKIPEFYRFWTAKEAFVKATGRGIGLGLKRCVINPENPSEFLRVPACCGQPSIWHIQNITLENHVRSTLVVDKNIVDVKLID